MTRRDGTLESHIRLLHVINGALWTRPEESSIRIESDAEYVLRHSPVPVLLVRGGS